MDICQSILNDGNTVNIVRHRMPCIHFQQGKRPKRYRLFYWYCKTSVCTHKLCLLPSPNSRGD